MSGFRLALPAAACVLAACSAATPATDTTDTGAPSSPPPEWNTGADWTDRGIQPATGSTCGPMLPVDAVGMVWRYTFEAGRDRGVMEREAVGLDELEGEPLWRVQETWWFERGGEPLGVEAHTFWYRCDAGGAWQIGWKKKRSSPDEPYAHPDRAWEICEDLLMGAPSLEPGQVFTMLMSCDEQGGGGTLQSRGIEVHDPTTVSLPSGEHTAIDVVNAFENHVVIPDVGSALITFEYNDWRIELFDAAVPAG